MGKRADNALAQAYWRATQGLLPREGFLEDALAAVLEDTAVWARLVDHLDWGQLVPREAPQVSTQDVVADGRTDIRLTWPEALPLVLELKVTDPPTVAQMSTYLATGVRVAAVATYPARIPVAPEHMGRFLGVITWRRIRDLDWPGAPLILRQLHHLLDRMEVAVPQLTLPTLTGMVASAPAWDTLDAWSYWSIQAVRDVFAQAGMPCEQKDTPKGRARIEDAHQRYAYWLWPPPWRADMFSFVAGLFLGRPLDPLCIDGMPDLLLAIHVQPESPLGQALRSDSLFRQAVMAWVEQDTEPEQREYRPIDGVWEIVRARASSVALLRAPDQGGALVAWMSACANAWVAHGIIARLAELERQTRPATGTGEHSAVAADSDDVDEPGNA
jgi:hypothetical protein